jgi:flagellar motor switch protein FliG
MFTGTTDTEKLCEIKIAAIEFERIFKELKHEKALIDMSVIEDDSIAGLFFYLDPKISAELMSFLPIERKMAILKILSELEYAELDVVYKLRDYLNSTFFLNKAKVRHQDNIKLIARIISFIDRRSEFEIIKALDHNEPSFSKQVRSKMFEFEDIALLNNNVIQRVLRNVDKWQLTFALKGTTDEIRSVFYRNMSKRNVEMISADMELIADDCSAYITKAKEEIVATVRKLEDEGEIFISR